MNRIYKVIWSKTKHCYVVVSELAKRHAKGGNAGGCRMMTVRVLSTLLLGAYLVGGYSLPSAWADGESQDVGTRTEGITRTSTDATNPVIYTTKIENSLTVTSDGKVQWGNGTQALGDYSTAFGNNTTTAAVTSLKYRDPYNNDWTEAKIITKNSDTGLKYVIVEAADPNKELYFSYFDTEEAAMNEIAREGKITGGYGATAFGLQSEAKGSHSTAFGVQTVAEGTGATAWGRYAKATGDYSTAWGFNTEAINDKSTAFGDNTIAGGKIATAWGNKTAAGGRTSTAFGSETVALTEGATAWGNNTKAGKWTYAGHDVFIKKEGDGRYHIIDEYGNSGSNGLPGQTFVSYDAAYEYISSQGTVKGVYATAWGNGTKAEGDYSTAFGNYTKTAAVTSIEYNGIVKKVNEEKYAIVDANNPDVILSNGYFDTEEEATKELRLNATITGGYGATAFGLYSEANGAHSTAFGVGTTARGTGATAFGFKTIANGDNSTAFGSGTRASGANSTAFGSGTTASDMNATAFGSRTIASSDNSTAFGAGTTAKGESSTAFGSGTTASGVYSTAFGEGTLADGSHSTAWGDYTQALSHKSTAFGDHTTAGHDNATAWGYETTAGDRTTTAFGDNTAALMEGATAWGHNTKAGKWTVKDDTGKVHDLIIETYTDHNPTGDSIRYAVKYAENKGTDDVFIGGQNSYTDAYEALKGRASTDPYVTMQGNYATAWGNGTEAEGDYSTAFGNYTKTAAVTSFKYYGTEAKVVSEVVVVKDANGNPVMITDPGNPESGETIPATELKYTIVNADNPEIKLSGTYFDSEDAAMNEIVQNGTITGGYGATAFGLLSEAKGAHSTAFGVGTTAEGIGATAWGNGAQATGDYSTAFGNGSVANASNSLAALGGTTAEDAVNSLAVGLGAQTTLPDSIALGSGAVADRAKYDGTDNKYTAYLGDETGETKTGSAWRATANAIAIGDIDTTDDTKSVTRQIIGVAAGTEDTDAVNVAQLKAATFDMQGITRTETGIPGEAGYVATTTIENNLSVSSDGKVKWGNGTKAEGDYSTAGGYNTKAMGKNATAFGNYTQANGYNSTAFGNAAKANGQYTTAFGSTTQANGQYATAFGNYTEANGYNSTAFGNYTQANGQDATAFGYRSIAAGDHSTAFGSYTQAGKLTYKKENGSETEAKIVEYTTAAGDRKYKIVSKDGNDDLSDNGGAGFYYYDVLRDSNLTKQGDYSTAFGSSTEALGDFSTAFGSNTQALGDYSTAFGSSTEANGQFATAFGSSTEASGPSSTAFGSTTQANGLYSTAFGSTTQANGHYATAFGSHTQAGKLTYKKDGSETEAKIVEYTTDAGNRRYKIVDLWNENDVLSDNNGAGFNMYESAFLDNNLTRQGDYSTAFGSSTIALGDYSTAWGFSAQANGNYSTAFGNGSVANAYNSLAALGGTTGEKATNSVAIGTGATVGGAYVSGNTETEGTNAFAFGNGAQATLSDSVALGSGAVANRAKYNASNNAYKAYLNEDDNNQKTDPAWRATHNAIAVGASATDSDTATVTRQITGVAAGTYDTDAVNVAQLKAATFNMQGITRTRSGNDNDGYTYTTTIEDKLSVSSNGAFSISGDKFTVDSDGAISAAGGISAAKGAGGYNFTVDSSDGSIRTNGNISAVGAISADNITVAEGTYSYISAGTDVAGSLVSLDNAVKANAGTIQGITRSGDATDGYTTTIEGKLSVSSNGAFSISGDKFTVDSDGAISAAGGKFVVGAEGTLSAGATTVSGLTVGTKERTTELTTEGVVADGDAGAGYVTGSTVATALAGKADVATTLAGYGITDAAKIDGSNVTTPATWGTKLGTGAIDLNNGELVTGGTVHAVTSALDTRITANTTALENKAGVDLANISDAGKTAVRSLIQLEQGDNVTVAKTTSESGVDTYRISAVAGSGSGLYNSGEGISITGTEINVNAGEDFTFDSNKLQLKKDGVIADGNTGVITGGKVYSALSAYAKSDGATLTNTTISSGNIADEVKLVGTDSTITVGTLKASVTANTSDISTLKSTVSGHTDSISALDETVNKPETGLVARVDKNTSAIGDASSGLTKAVADNATAIAGKADKATTLTGYGITDAYTIMAADEKFAQKATTLTGYGITDAYTKTAADEKFAQKATTLSGYGITDAYTKTAADNKFAQKAATLSGYGITDAAMVDASNIDAAVWGTKLGTGAVASGNAGLVTGGTVYTEVRPANGTYVKKANTTAANLSALDTQVKANADAIADKADASVVSELTDMVGANEKAIEKNATNIAANKTAIDKNANDISSLGTRVTANETALAKKADKANTLKGYGIEDAYTKEDTDTLLNKKADKTELAEVKATADSNKAALDALGDVQELAKDAEAVRKIADDVETVVKEQDGVVAEEGQKNADELVKGSTVYDYLNKGKDGDGKLVLGTDSKSISIGKDSEATEDNSIAIGTGIKVHGKRSGAIGDPGDVFGDDSYVIGNNPNVNGNGTFVVGNNANVTGDTNFVLGHNANVTGKNNIVLGNDVTVENVDDAIVIGNGSTAEAGAVSVGSKDGERQIKHVAPGEDDTDAATVGQVREVNQAAYNNAVNLSNSINKLDSRISKVGAGAAALAALHPIDTDDKFTMGLGYGNYRSANAMAMGMFYRPTEKMMISVGGAFGNGENMVNAGISIALDKNKGFGTSKAVMAKNIKALSAENAAIKEENADMRKQLNAQDAKLTTQEAEIQALKAALARLEAKIGK